MSDNDSMNRILLAIEKMSSDIVGAVGRLNNRIEKLEHQLESAEETRIKQEERLANELVASINRASQNRKPVYSEMNSVPSGRNLEAEDILTLLERVPGTIKEGFKTAQSVLKADTQEAMFIRAKEMKDYSESFSKDFVELFSKKMEENSDRLTELLTRNDNRFTDNLSSLTDSLAVRNAEALQSVQRENNEELKNLSVSLERSITAQEAFAKQCSSFNAELKKDISRIIQQNEGVVDAFDRTAEKSATMTDKLLAKRLEELSNRLDALEQKNAAAFHSTMEDYRERFVEASAEAIGNVQSDVLRQTEEAQAEIKKLSSNVNSAVSAISEIPEMLQTHHDEQMELFTETLNSVESSASESLNRMEDTQKKIRRSIERMEEELKKNADLIRTNSENYQNALDTIRKDHEDARKLSEDDAKMLKRLLKEK